jgi:DNA-directed RNA polymerase specialized sigma24 family protein
MAETQESTSPATSFAPATLLRYSRALHNYLLQRLRRGRDDTADLTQEIFERFLRKRDRPEVIRNPLAYLYGIASHVVAETIEQFPHRLLTYDRTSPTMQWTRGPSFRARIWRAS